MNRKIITAAVLAAAFAGSAFAEGPLYPNDPFTGARTRAEVQADLAAYKQAGVNPWSTTYNPLRSFKSTQSREQVTAGYLASRAEVAALTGEDSGSAWIRTAQRNVAGQNLAGTPANAQ